MSIHQHFYPTFSQISEVEHVQAIANKSGVIRTEETFSGVVFKGVGLDYDQTRFEEFLTKGRFPKFKNNELSDEVLLSEKMANELKLEVDSSFVMYFLRDDAKPIYRRFHLVGLYKTDIKNFDDIYLIGDIQHIQRLNNWGPETVGAFEVFVKDIEKVEQVTHKINDVIGYNLYAESAMQSFAQISEWINVFDKNIVIIVIIMLFVVVINMVMVLLILILDRTPSIGLLKAFGATNWRIRRLFVCYVILIMIPGLFIGNILGIGLLLLQKYAKIVQLPSENYYLSYAPVYLDIKYIVLLNVGALVICAIVLLLPSYMISKITPTKAINFR